MLSKNQDSINLKENFFNFNGIKYVVSKTSRIESNQFDPNSKFYYYYEDSSAFCFDVVEIPAQLAHRLLESFNIPHKSK